jgi:hypothetical protein
VGVQSKNKDVVPRGQSVQDPTFRFICEENGVDPDQEFFYPIDAKSGEVTLDELVKWSQGAAREDLKGWLPGVNKDGVGEMGTAFANDFVDDLISLLSDPGCEIKYQLVGAEKLVHDIIWGSEDYPYDVSYDEQVVWCENRLREINPE